MSPEDIKIPKTMQERDKEWRELHGEKLPHPDSPVWFDRHANYVIAKRFFWAPPYDARFPQYRRQKMCFSYYVDYFRCLELMGEDYKPCKYFKNVYKTYCPSTWIDKWDDLRENDTFPAMFYR